MLRGGAGALGWRTGASKAFVELFDGHCLGSETGEPGLFLPCYFKRGHSAFELGW